MHCKNRITDVFLADTMQQNEAGMLNAHKCFWPRHPPVTPLNINMPQDKQRRCAAAVTPLAVNTIQSNMRHASVTPLDWPSTKTVTHAHLPAEPKHGRALPRKDGPRNAGSRPKNSGNLCAALNSLMHPSLTTTWTRASTFQW